MNIHPQNSDHSIHQNKDIDMFLHSSQPFLKDRLDHAGEVVLEYNLKPSIYEDSKSRILDQEIKNDLNIANELIEDSEIMLREPARMSANHDHITDNQIIKNLPKLKTPIKQVNKDINQLLDSLDSKRAAMMNHFTPDKVSLGKHKVSASLNYEVCLYKLNFV